MRPSTISLTHRPLCCLASDQPAATLAAVLPLTAATEAHRKLEQGEHFGKIVLTTD